MFELILTISLLLVISGLAWVFWRGKKIADSSRQMKKKENNQAKILEFLHENESANNEDLRKLLSVSARTVVRYMDELEAEGLVEQVGNVGQSVQYKLKQK